MKKLPSIEQPLFKEKLPSTGKEILYRPFTGREEKILLIGKESKDIEQIILSLEQVLQNCIPNENINDLSIFDLEYMMLLIRSKSVNNIVEFGIEDDETNEIIEIKLNIADMKLHTHENHKKEIKVNDDYVLYMKYPSFKEYMKFMTKEDDENELEYFNLMISCFDKLVSTEDVYEFKDFTIEEITKFADDLNTFSLKQIKDFFETMPSLRHEIKYKNKTGKEKTFVIEGTESFFI